MDYSWSQAQLDLKKSFVDFASSELDDDIMSGDKESKFSKVNWQKCAEFGVMGLASTLEYGGKESQVDILCALLAMEGFGYGCKDNGLAFALNAQMWTVQLPILHFGTDFQKKKYLEPLVKGEIIGAHALTEPETGSDVYSMKMTAEKVSDGYLLNGKKRLVSLAPISNLILVFANANPKIGKWGVTAFLVESKSMGIELSPSRNKMGLRTVPIGEINFENCFVPEENRLGKEGAGFSISNHSLEYERCSIMASQIGTMDRQLEIAVKYAKNREQFGKPIGKFQSISNRVSDMKLRLETSRLLLYKVAWLKNLGKPALMDSALLKVHLSESFVSSSLDSIRIHGGNGYLTDYGVERDLRDAVGGLLYAGTSDIQRNIISKLLGL